MRWDDKRYHSLNHHYRERFGGKVIKIPLDAGFTCPNRDGTAGFGGCIFCADGSADISSDRGLSIENQFQSVRENLHSKWPKARYIAYFQANTNTYAPAEILLQRYQEALAIDDVAGISIATRPDCLGDDVLSVLDMLVGRTAVYVELGLQTAHERTAKLINRCYGNDVFKTAVARLKSLGIHVVAHVILGLPHEDKNDMLETVQYAVNCGINGIKLQLLHILNGTELADMYLAGQFRVLCLEEYLELVVSSLELLPEDVVVHRLTGDGIRDMLIAPRFSLDKRRVLNGIDRELSVRGTYQSRLAYRG